MTTIDGAPFVDTPVNDITFKFPTVERNLPKDLTKTKNSCDNVLNLFQDAKHNRDLFDKTISLVTDGKNILLEINDFDAQKIEGSPIFRKFSDCISRLETFNQSNSTDEVLQGISKLNDELEASINGLRKLLDELKPGNEYTRWNGKVKKKFKALGKMVTLRKSILPPEREFSVYDVSRMVEPVKPPVLYGSKSHITKGLYVDTIYVALKEIGELEKGDLRLIELTKEMDFIKSLECKNVLEIYGIHRQGINYSIVSRWEEYNLQTYLSECYASFTNIDWTKKLIISRGIADALKFIHQKGIRHYDIKSHNIYLNSYFEAKLHNFRIAKDSPIILTSANEPTDHRWSPPERLRGEEYTKASDIYSFSLVLWEIVNQQIPYHDISPDDIKNLVLIGTHPTPKETNGTPIEYQDIMEKGWNLSPDQRPTIEEMFDVLARLEVAEKCCRRISRVGDDINTSNNFLSPNSAIKDGNVDDASSIISVGSVDFVTPSGYNVTTHLGKRKGIDKFNPFQKSTVDFEEAVRLHKDGNYNQAWKIIKEVKKRTQTPDANFWVGYYHVKGFHKQKGKSNPTLGVEYLWQAAKEDHADAQYHYANAILNLGCVAEEHRNEKRFKIAMELLEKAARQDHPLALKKLGSIRKRGLYGKGVDIDAGKDMIKRGRAMTLQDPQVDRPRSSLHEARPTNKLVRHSTVTS